MENHIFFMGKSTIFMAIFNSYVSLPEGIWYGIYLSVVGENVVASMATLKSSEFPDVPVMVETQAVRK